MHNICHCVNGRKLKIVRSKLKYVRKIRSIFALYVSAFGVRFNHGATHTKGARPFRRAHDICAKGAIDMPPSKRLDICRKRQSIFTLCVSSLGFDLTMERHT